MDNFADHPVSITEARANRTDGGADVWTARDVLISVLRDIDSGKLDADQVAVVVSVDNDGDTKFHYFQRCHSTLALAGLFSTALHDLHKGQA